ncbi:MAG: hypothetical protein IKH27_12715 [Oscillospiraceae bacterium]|nr:hypothetical protein [Oscillospiraceae bacterium]
MTDLFFCPERWEPDPMISGNEAEMRKVTGFSGKTADAWQLGDWGTAWSAISSVIPVETGWLEPGAEYRFCFWLNGGENSRQSETCALEIFGDDWEDRLSFPLNRGRTKPILEKNHWLLYGIPFTAPEAAAELHFRFVAAGAVCTVAGIPDMDMAACEALNPDPPETGSPQRYNIVFASGYPNHAKRSAPRSDSAAAVKKVLCMTAAAAGIAVGSVLLYRALHEKKLRK